MLQDMPPEMLHAFMKQQRFADEQPLDDSDRELLRKVVNAPEDTDLLSALKRQIVVKPMLGAPLVDTYALACKTHQEKTAKIRGKLAKLEKEKNEREQANKFIGEYLYPVDGEANEHEVYVVGQGEKVLPASSDIAEEQFKRGEKVYLSGQGQEMEIVWKTGDLYHRGGEHGILTGIADDFATATVSLDGKQCELETCFPVQEKFAGEELSTEDLPLPVLVLPERRQVTHVLPEPAISSELNPFLKRDVTLEKHAGYRSAKWDFVKSVLSRYMARLENRVYLEGVDLPPEKLRGEAVGVACVGQPGSGKTTLINAVINLLDRFSLAQIAEKIEVIRLYLRLSAGEPVPAAEALEAFAAVSGVMHENHSLYRHLFELEEPRYRLRCAADVLRWAEAYVLGYGVKPDRATRELKRLIKMRQARRSEVQLMLIRHEDTAKKYVGEGVGYIGLVFRKARRHRGFVFIWIPEAETIFKARGTGLCSDYNDEVVAKFNEELAGSSSNDNLIAVADSNHPQSMDDAILGHRFVRLDIGRIAPDDLRDIVQIHVDRLELDSEAFPVAEEAAEQACDLICDRLLAPTPIAEAVKAGGAIGKKIKAQDILVPRIIAFIASRAKKHSLSRKTKRKRVRQEDLLRACHEELRHQATQIKPGNLGLFLDLEPQELSKFTHVRVLVEPELELVA